MEALPVEIIEEIFRSLYQQDKLECMLVCRSWEHFIKRKVLFNTIRVGSKEQLNKLVAKVRQEPLCGDRVERLVLVVKGLTRSDINTLPPLFSNIREITLFQDFIDDRNQPIPNKRFSHPWKEKIRAITNERGYFLVHKILRGGICPQLTVMKFDGRNRQTPQKLIELLENVPNLKTLNLTGYSLDPIKLEVLHNNIPLLESFSFTYRSIDSGQFPTEIMPAHFMKELNVKSEGSRTNEDFINLQKYLSKKYPRIVHFGIKLGWFGRDLNMKVCMNEGIALYIQQIGLYLTSFEYDHSVDSIQLILPILDQSGCEIKRFNIKEKVLSESEFQCIAQSQQAQHLQALSCKIGSSSIITSHFNTLSALTELKLYMKPGPNKINVNLGHLMREIGGNLKTFGLSHAKISLNTLFVPLCPNIKNVELTQTTLSPGTDFFLSHVFPNLLNLVIIRCNWISPVLCLDNSKLFYLEIRMLLPSEDDHILIITTNNNEKYWYTAKKLSNINDQYTSNHILFPAVKSIPFDRFTGMPFKTILCQSLKSFFLVNTRS